MTDLDDAITIARSLETIEDTRPEWLRRLPHADDPQALYYRALYEWTRKFQPARILEIGTDRGWSAAHMAAGAPHSSVVTLDIRPESADFVRALPIANIVPLTMSSSMAAQHVMSFHPFDMLYIDANHTFNEAYGEYTAYRPVLRDGALIVFDDLALDMLGDEMGVFWAHVLDPKARLDHLHHTGFGICQVNTSIHVPPWRDIIEGATRRILGYQCT
jgi:predicted O-methyltransferase YrrM